jgi:ABC-type transport system involved in multi-copper enzyme maturation permease subunit
MNSTLILRRELGAQSRQASNYWLRVCGALLVSIVFAVLAVQEQEPAPVFGARLLATLHTALLAGIWIFGPALTADCISGEKREGTLGLLVLTPLTASSLVVGKSLIHLLRAWALWLACVPILTIPFLLGGIGWVDVLSAVTLEFCSVLLVLASGLLGSAMAAKAGRAFALAECIAVCMALLLGLVLATTFALLIPIRPVLYRELPRLAVALSSGLMEEGRLLSLSGLPVWLLTLGISLLFSAVICLLVILISAWLLKRTWRDEPPSAATLRRRQRWFAPRFGVSSFRRAMRRKLDRNPIGWLQARSVGSRVARWIWFGVVLVTDLSGIINPDLEIWPLRAYVIAFLLLGLAFTSARSFREERQNGIWEMLLVSPLSARDLVVGRLRGMWAQFVPAMIVVFCALLGRHEVVDFAVILLMVLTSFLTVPLVGLYLSLRVQNLLVAWLGTFAFAVLWPITLMALAPEVLHFLRDQWKWWQPEWLLRLTEQRPFLWFWVAQAPPAFACAALVFRGIRQQQVSRR